MSHVYNILATAAKTIDKRAAERDLPQERSMAAVVTAFNAIFGKDLTESQGWQFMELLKIKRAAIGPYNQDSFVDGAAYVALASEARKAEWEATNRVAETMPYNGADYASDEAVINKTLEELQPL